MPLYTDQLGRTLRLDHLPQRIVSLVPSQTELLYALGLDKEVIGITKFCVHPEHWFRSKTRIGGTKNIKPGIIHPLQPDLILANKEENVREQVEALTFPTWVSDVNTLEEALDMIVKISALTGRTNEGKKLESSIRQGFGSIGDLAEPILRTGYLIWREPYMTVGNDTFIHDMLRRAGLMNVFGERTRYPSITIEDLQNAGCELLLLSSEPYPFRQSHLDELQHHLPGTIILLADGELFSWYGSRLLHAPAYFRQLKTQALSLRDAHRKR